MNLLSRLVSRIQEDGLGKTIKYISYVGWSEIKTKIENALIDLKYSKRILSGHLPTAYKHLGANDVYHTEYSAMSIIFNQIFITPQDVLVDVGCGKGRVINFWLSQGFNNKIYGLEIDPQVAHNTSEQFKPWNNVVILPGDAIRNLPVDGTIFYLYNPFSKERFHDFEARIAELSLNKQITLLYYRPKSLSAFNKKRWNIRIIDFDRDLAIRQWGRINKYHQLAIITPKNTNITC